MIKKLKCVKIKEESSYRSKKEPVCNHTIDVGKDNLGYTKGKFLDGNPYEAEIWMNNSSMNVSFVFPNLLNIVVNKICLRNGNVLGFHNQDERINAGVLTIGMVDNGILEDLNEIIAYVDYLKEQKVIEFVSDMENGAVFLVTDIEGNELIHVIITLMEDDKLIAYTPLTFDEFLNHRQEAQVKLLNR